MAYFGIGISCLELKLGFDVIEAKCEALGELLGDIYRVGGEEETYMNGHTTTLSTHMIVLIN